MSVFETYPHRSDHYISKTLLSMKSSDSFTWSLEDTELPGESGGQTNESSDRVLDIVFLKADQFKKHKLHIKVTVVIW